MSEALVSSGRAPYARCESVWACPSPPRVGRRARIADFAAHVAAVVHAPSVFGPPAGAPADVAAEVGRADWGAPRWHLFASDGSYRESLTEETFRARWRSCGADPFLCVPARYDVFRMEARIEGFEASFVLPFSAGAEPRAAFRGLVRLGVDGAPLVPADAPLSVQATRLLRAGETDGSLHMMHLEVLWRLIRGAAEGPQEWADMKVTVDLIDHPELVRGGPSDDAALTSALLSARIARAEAASVGRPALAPPRPRWERDRRRQA